MDILNMLVAARNAEVEQFVFAASSSTYGEHPDLPKTEDTIGNPLGPYSVTKLVNEHYAQVFHRIYDMNTIGLRYFNVFGKRQNPEGAYAAVIPKWVPSILSGESVIINGDGTTSRNFCYIENTIQMNLLSATIKNSKALNQIYNAALKMRTSLNEFLALINEKILKLKPDLIINDLVYRDFRQGDIMHSLANISKAKKLLGYLPTHDVSKGLDEAMEWYVNESKN